MHVLKTVVNNESQPIESSNHPKLLDRFRGTRTEGDEEVVKHRFSPTKKKLDKKVVEFRYVFLFLPGKKSVLILDSIIFLGQTHY